MTSYTCLPLFLLLLGTSFLACNSSGESTHSVDGHAHGDESSHLVEDVPRGVHGGRLFGNDDFQIELLIVEHGTAPQFYVYGFAKGHPIAPSEFKLAMTLHRLGNQLETIQFEASQDALVSTQTIAEPHSFTVDINATHDSKPYSWSYETFEGRVEMSDAIAQRAQIASERAEPRRLLTKTTISGKIVPSEHRIAHIVPRFPGLVREGRKHIGDRVEKGEVLAIIESNQSLQPFEVRSQISGTVINGHLIVGEYVPENQWVYIVADLSEVWADLLVPLRDRSSVSLGQAVSIRSVENSEETAATISYVAPYADDRSQSQLVRAVIANEKQRFLPGMFISGEIVLSEQQVPIAVRKEALQRFRNSTVVFAKFGTTYEIRPVTLGNDDGEWVEIVSGIAAGQEYATQNSFVLKADILKLSASHDH